MGAEVALLPSQKRWKNLRVLQSSPCLWAGHLGPRALQLQFLHPEHTEPCLPEWVEVLDTCIISTSFGNAVYFFCLECPTLANSY